MLYVRYIYVVFETSTYCLRTAYVLLVVRKNIETTVFQQQKIQRTGPHFKHKSKVNSDILFVLSEHPTLLFNMCLSVSFVCV